MGGYEHTAATANPKLRVVKRTAKHSHKQASKQARARAYSEFHSPTHAFKFTELINEKKSEKMLNA